MKSCTESPPSANSTSPAKSVSPVEAPVGTLLEIVQRYGSPAYAYDLARIRAQIAKLQAHVSSQIDVLYSLKANASLGLCGFIAEHGFGADVASAGELLTARAAGFPPGRIFVTGPDRSPALLEALRSVPEAILSIDSLSELRMLAGRDRHYRAILRLRPDFCSYATCAAGPDSRFGLLFEELPQCREYLHSRGIQIVGFHVFSGSQVLDAKAVIHHLRGGVDLSLRAADVLDLAPEIIDLGGGFGVPYAPEDRELDLALVAEELALLRDRVAPVRLVLELGRYFVAQAGWYLTTVIGQQTHRGRPAVVVDGGTHQRGDLCGLDLRHKAFPPVVLRAGGTGRDYNAVRSSLAPTDVLGCLSLPADVLAESALLPPLMSGDVLAFPNAGAYGFSASPLLFHGHAPPAEAAFEGDRVQLLRGRRRVTSVLEDQLSLREPSSAG